MALSKETMTADRLNLHRVDTSQVTDGRAIHVPGEFEQRNGRGVAEHAAHVAALARARVDARGRDEHRVDDAAVRGGQVEQVVEPAAAGVGGARSGG